MPSSSPTQPFFQYVAFIAPHFPLHALQEDIARYREKYRGGWEQIREQRWRRLRDMGIVQCELSAVEREVGPPYDFPAALEKLGAGEVNRPLPWSELTDQQRVFQAAKMAVHAAMVDRMDREIGKILDQLSAMGVAENTLVFFLSDNGASAEIMVRGDDHDPAAPPGSAASYLCLGPGWSNCANTPFRRHKTWVHEGGISTPLIVRWPRGIKTPGALRHNPGHVIDLVPTILDAAGIDRVAVVERPAGTRTHRARAWCPYSRPTTASLTIVSGGCTKTIERFAWATGNWWRTTNRNSGNSTTSARTAANRSIWRSKFPEKVQELSQAWEDRWREFRELATQDEQ